MIVRPPRKASDARVRSPCPTHGAALAPVLGAHTKTLSGYGRRAFGRKKAEM